MLVTHNIHHPSRNLKAWDAKPEFPVHVGANALTAQAAPDLQQVCKD